MKRVTSLLLFFASLLLSVAATAQDFSVKGKVTDATGQPVIGANIKVKEAQTGVITDMDGNFIISVPSKHKELIVSFIGYKSQTVKVAPGMGMVQIQLKEDAQSLDEIVIIGYGTQKKSSLTSSVETIKREDLLQMPTANLDEALSGQVAGLQVMSSTGDPSSAKEASMRIRAVSGAQNATLLVIDGVPRFSENTSGGEERLSDLNPDDIESISILKDAAAAAVYGVRAANGVILVKTKRGSGDSKIRVNYRGQFNIQKGTQFPKFLNSYEFAKLYNRAVEGVPNTEPFTDEELEMIRTQSHPNEFADSNMLDYLKKQGHSTTHAISLSGGNNFLKYYISGAYTNTVGLYSGVGRDRYNYSMKLDATLLKGLVLSVDMTGSRSSNKNTSYTTMESAYGFSPVQPLILTNGELASIDSSNPLISVRGLGGYAKSQTKMNTITANLQYELPWVKGLSVYLKGTVDDNSMIQKNFYKPVALYKWDKKTEEISVDDKTIYPKAKISLQQKDQFVDNVLIEAGINYNRTFSGKHEVSGTLIANYQDYSNRNMNGTNPDMPGIYPEVLGTTPNGQLTGNEYKTQRASLIGRATYGYRNRYFVETSFRVDGSARFHPDHRWGFFPTISTSWVLSNEAFFKNWRQNVLSNLKLRASTGILGRDGDISDYAYLMNYMYSPREGYDIGGTLRPGIIMATGSYPNKELSWEKSRDYNMAVDLGFWDNRFGFTFEYYLRYRTNMLTSAPSYLYPPSTGVGGNVPYMNFGKVKAWGWDMTLSHRNTIDKVKYDAALTLSLGRDKYLDYGDESAQLENLRRVGHSTGDTWMYEAIGLFQTEEEIANYKLKQDGNDNKSIRPGDIKYKDRNDDGKLDDNDKVAFKTASFPDISGSLRLGVRYKGFFVNTLFQGVGGYKKYISESYTLENSSLQRFQDYHLTETWTEENRNAAYPRIKLANSKDNNRLKSSFWIKNCNFIRLKSLNIGYSFPAAVLSKLKVTSLSVALQGGNLFTWSNLKHMDPESMRGYPIQRTYGISANIGF